MRVCMLDIETTSFDAGVGRVLCVCIKPYGPRQPTITIRQDQFPGWRKETWDDSKLVDAVLKELTKYDMVVTYYGRFFDLPFLTSRGTLINRQPPLNLFHCDLHVTAKKYIKMFSRKLVRIQEFFELAEKKTPLQLKTWAKASTGNVPALDEVVEHCIADVMVLESAYNKLLPYITSLKRVLI